MPAYECTICMEYFDAGHNIPTTFPCGHSCCLRHTLEMLLCHVCRAPLPEDGLTPNITLRDLSVEFAEMARNMRQMALAMAALTAPAPAAETPPAATVELMEEATITADIGQIEGHVPVLAADDDMEPAVSETVSHAPLSKKPRKRSNKKKKAAGRQMQQSLFFSLLPIDLQIEVIQTWLGVYDDDFVCSVSALDIACCNKAIRPAFLHLISRPFVAQRHRESCIMTVKKHGSYLRWLHSRQVPVQWFQISDEIDDWTEDMDSEAFSLPNIVDLALIDCTDHAEALIRACPNLNALLVHKKRNVGESLWGIIARYPHLRFTTLNISEALRDENDENLLCAALALFGAQLLELRIIETTLTSNIHQAILRNCKHITELGITMDGAPAERIMQLLLECTALTCVSFIGVGNFSSEDLLHFLLSNQNLSSLAVCRTGWGGELIEKTVARIVGECQWVRLLFLDGWEIDLDRRYATFHVTSDTTLQTMDTILFACRKAAKLKVNFHSFSNDHHEMMSRIGKAMGKALKSIKLVCHAGLQVFETDLLALVCQCPGLKRLRGDFVLNTHEGLKLFQRRCPKAIVESGR